MLRRIGRTVTMAGNMARLCTCRMKAISRFAFCFLVTVALFACGHGPGSGGSGQVLIGVNAKALATRADIASVFVQLTPASGATPLQGFASNASSAWSIVFGSVPVGDYAVYAKAVDASQATLYQTPQPYPGGPVTVSDGGTTQVTLLLQDTHASTAPVDSAPYLTSLFASQAQVDQMTVVRFDASAADPDGSDPLTFAWTATDGTFRNTASDATTSHTTWTPPGNGTFTATVTVKDPAGASAQMSVAIQVSAENGSGTIIGIVDLNSPPVILSVTSSNAQGVVGQPVPLTAIASDVDGDTILFTWSDDCDGTFDAVVSSPVSTGTQSATAFTAPAAPAGSVCHISLNASDGRGGSTTSNFSITYPGTSVGEGPFFYLLGSIDGLPPDGTLDVTAVPSDGAAHPTWSYAWSDDRPAAAAGTFAAAGDPSHQLYTPADCVLLGGNDQTITVSALVTDTATGASSQRGFAVVVHCPAPTFLTTKTPYHPHQDAATYEAPPAGFTPAYTELVARHGSRGLSSLKYDAAAYNMWQRASADGSLTALGAGLGADIQRFMRANALLGLNVPGISNPGYGNLTLTGISEQRQLAARMLARLPGYFASVAANSRFIFVQSSGVARAVDSASFFSSEINAENPALGSLVVQPAAPVGYPVGFPMQQALGTNRFLLYFHKLTPAIDLVTDPADPNYQTYQDSLAFQAYASDPNMTAKVAGILADPSAKAAARTVLQTVFTDDFIGKIDDGTYTFANTGAFTFTSDDGSLVTTLNGDGKTTVASLTDAASMLYNLYVVAPAMTNEVTVNFAQYVPTDAARVLSYLQDAQDFYQMGPSITELNPVTYKMAQALENDFFSEIDTIVAGNTLHGAKLRFTHAEIIVPFASILGLKKIFVPMPLASTYSYASNPWRGELVSPFAANLQWDVFSDANGTFLVKMLYNEKETDFKADCDGARFGAGSHFYDYSKLKACYGRP
jgi:hypothetical protein